MEGLGWGNLALGPAWGACCGGSRSSPDPTAGSTPSLEGAWHQGRGCQGPQPLKDHCTLQRLSWETWQLPLEAGTSAKATGTALCELWERLGCRAATPQHCMALPGTGPEPGDLLGRVWGWAPWEGFVIFFGTFGLTPKDNTGMASAGPSMLTACWKCGVLDGNDSCW